MCPRHGLWTLGSRIPCTGVVVSRELKKELSMPVMAEYSFLRRSEGGRTENQIKGLDKSFNY